MLQTIFFLHVSAAWILLFYVKRLTFDLVWSSFEPRIWFNVALARLSMQHHRLSPMQPNLPRKRPCCICGNVELYFAVILGLLWAPIVLSNILCFQRIQAQCNQFSRVYLRKCWGSILVRPCSLTTVLLYGVTISLFMWLQMRLVVVLVVSCLSWMVMAMLVPLLIY